MYTTVCGSNINDAIVHVDHSPSTTLLRKGIEIVLFRAKGIKLTHNSFLAKMYTSTHAQFGMNNVHHSLC